MTEHIREAEEVEGTVDIPPKLPDTTNLVLTRSRKEYREIAAMNVKVRAENSSPPFKKLEMIVSILIISSRVKYTRPSKEKHTSSNERLE